MNNIKQIDEYLTRDEIEEEIDVYIEKMGDKLISEIGDRKNGGKLKTNDKVLCMN